MIMNARRGISDGPPPRVIACSAYSHHFTVKLVIHQTRQRSSCIMIRDRYT